MTQYILFLLILAILKIYYIDEINIKDYTQIINSVEFAILVDVTFILTTEIVRLRVYTRP